MLNPREWRELATLADLLEAVRGLPLETPILALPLSAVWPQPAHITYENEVLVLVGYESVLPPSRS